MASPDNTAEQAALREDYTAEQIEEINARAEKLGVKLEELLALPMTHEDVLYLLETCPYLQIINSETRNEIMSSTPRIFQAQSGWMIHDYGDAMTSSPGALLYADNRADPTFLLGLGTHGTEEDESGGGKGTIIKQSVDTAAEMVFAGIQRGWKGVTILEGHPRMKWAAWVMAGDHQFSVEGYEPDEAHLAQRDRMRRSRDEIDRIYEQSKQVKKPT